MTDHLAQFPLNESATLEFGVEIFGTENNTLDARFIIEGPDFSIICKCEESGGVITAKVPKLESILQPGVYSSKLELIVDGKHFQPLTENIQLNRPVSVSLVSGIKVSQENVVKVSTGKISVRMQENSVTAKPLNREEVKKASFSGYVDKDVIFSESTDKSKKIDEMYSKMKAYEEQIVSMKKKNKK